MPNLNFFSAKKNIFRLFFFSIFCLSMGFTFAQWQSVKSESQDTSIKQSETSEINNSKQAGNTPLRNLLPSPSPTPEIPHNLVGSYYTVENNLSAKLLLNNKGNTQLEIQPTLYNLQGQELQLPIVTVEPQSFRFINLQDWTNIGGESFRSGNIKLFHYGKDLVLGAQIYLTDETHSLSFEEKLTEIGKFDSRQLETVWVMPTQQAQAQVVLTNTTNASLSLTARLSKNPTTVGNPQTFQLAAHETKILDLRQDFTNGNQFANATLVGLSLEHYAVKNALLARVMVKDTAKGYSNVVQFSNPNGGKSSEYQGVGFQIEDIGELRFAPIIAAKNVGASTATVMTRVPYTRIDGTRGTITLPQKQLSAGEISLIDTRNIVTRVRQEQIKVASLEVEYNTAPGSVIIAAHSVSSDGSQVFRVPMWDPLGQRSPTGGYPWRIEGTSVTETYIKNITEQEQDYVAFLVWENGGMYMIGLKPIAPHETIHIDVKKLRDEQIPDEQGRVIPLYVSSGQLQWTLRRKDSLPEDDVRANLALVGRSEQVDITKGTTNNYSCQNCCAGDFAFYYLLPGDRQTTLGVNIQYDAYEEGETCYGSRYIYQLSRAYPQWSSSNQDVATINSTGYATTVGNGETEIKAKWYTRSYYETAPCPPGPVLWETDIISECGNENTQMKIQVEAANLLPDCDSCASFSRQVSATSDLTVAGVSVNSLSASIPSTDSGIGEFSTTNTSLAFATGSDDLMVIFKGSDDVTVQAEGVSPSNGGNLIKWKVDRDPTDTVETGLPTVSPQVGQSVTLTPNKAGNFRLISYYDANNNNTFEVGEQLRVLKFVITRMFVDTCTITNNNVFTGTTLGDFVEANTSSVFRTCDIRLEGGGSSKNIGLDKVKIGLIANIYNQSFEVRYKIGRFRIINEGVLPQLYKDDVIPSPPNGGSSVFRGNNNDGGAVRQISYDNTESTSIFLKMHPTNNTDWEYCVGGPKYDEFISAYSETFSHHYVVVAKVNWEVFFNGNADANLEWVNNGANVYLNGPNTGNANFDIIVNNDPNSPQGGSVTPARSVQTTSGQPLNVDTLYSGTIDYPESLHLIKRFK